MHNDFRQAYLLHRRPYSDSQAMLSMLVEGVGHLTMLARLKGKQSVKHSAQLQPFTPILCRYAGNYDLKYLNQFELVQNPLPLKGKPLYCAFYLNELSYRVIPSSEPQEYIYELYQKHLKKLVDCNDFEPVLRSYEYQLLEALGFGVEFDMDADGDEIKDKYYYQYIPELGFVVTDNPQMGFNGKVLNRMASGEFADPEVRKPAKYLSRYLLKPLLGNKALKSRELFLSR
ncbi:DNA repair protein RecO [Pseudoalteromonas sp. MTN2-4]|uniref:DNA repair protein RecO n=1 Tax=Pseudoalteromonas sp. MTN2-4 TaxID=3056555 RepID=UPI0036F3CE40